MVDGEAVQAQLDPLDLAQREAELDGRARALDERERALLRREAELDQQAQACAEMAGQNAQTRSLLERERMDARRDVDDLAAQLRDARREMANLDAALLKARSAAEDALARYTTERDRSERRATVINEMLERRKTSAAEQERLLKEAREWGKARERDAQSAALVAKEMAADLNEARRALGEARKQLTRMEAVKLQAQAAERRCRELENELEMEQRRRR